MNILTGSWFDKIKKSKKKKVLKKESTMIQLVECGYFKLLD